MRPGLEVSRREVHWTRVQFADARIALTKQKKHQDHQTLVFSSTQKSRSQIKRGPARSTSTIQLQQKFQNFKKMLRGQSLFAFMVMAKAIWKLLPEMGLLKEEHHPFESQQRWRWKRKRWPSLLEPCGWWNLRKDWKKLRALWVLRNLKSFVQTRVWMKMMNS